MSQMLLYNLPKYFYSKSQSHIVRKKTNPNKVADITLINLNLMLVNHQRRLERQNYIPLGILYVAAYLEKNAFNVEFIDYQLYSHSSLFQIDDFVKKISNFAPVVGLSCMSNLLPFAILLAKRIKQFRPKCKIVLGGVGPSPVAKQISREFNFVDYVVVGEGELQMLEIMQKGFLNDSDKKVLLDLNSLPLPAYHLLQLACYDAAPSLITSRGCPHKCLFCTEPHNFGGSLRFRDIDSVKEEVDLLYSLTGQKLFLFQDDSLIINRTRFQKLVYKLNKMHFLFLWKCFARIDEIDDELMKYMAYNGCVQIRFGIESGSNKILKKIGKPFSIEQAFEIVVKSSYYFPSVHTSFMWGFPFETKKDFQKTIFWIDKFKKAGITVLLFEYSPLPGSDIYKNWNNNLIFNQKHYSSFVLTGSENIIRNRYESHKGSIPTFNLIKKFPNIFPGFYHYKNIDYIYKYKMISSYRQTSRTPLKNEYDL